MLFLWPRNALHRHLAHDVPGCRDDAKLTAADFLEESHVGGGNRDQSLWMPAEEAGKGPVSSYFPALLAPPALGKLL